MGCTGKDGHGVSMCNGTMAPTVNDPKYLTYLNNSPWPKWFDFTANNPWRAPGHAPVQASCGLAAGWFTEGEAGNGANIPEGAHLGEYGRELPAVIRSVWTAGSVQEVGMRIFANHGGGYAYRLCPRQKILQKSAS